MSKKEKFDPVSAETFLLKQKISIKNKVIDVKGGVGLKCLSAIDYLVNFAGYTARFSKEA